MGRICYPINYAQPAVYLSSFLRGSYHQSLLSTTHIMQAGVVCLLRKVHTAEGTVAVCFCCHADLRWACR